MCYDTNYANRKKKEEFLLKWEVGEDDDKSSSTFVDENNIVKTIALSLL